VLLEAKAYPRRGWMSWLFCGGMMCPDLRVAEMVVITCKGDTGKMRDATVNPILPIFYAAAAFLPMYLPGLVTYRQNGNPRRYSTSEISQAPIC
jgi:hypothetical protein